MSEKGKPRGQRWNGPPKLVDDQIVGGKIKRVHDRGTVDWGLGEEKAHPCDRCGKPPFDGKLHTDECVCDLTVVKKVTLEQGGATLTLTPGRVLPDFTFKVEFLKEGHMIDRGYSHGVIQPKVSIEFQVEKLTDKLIKKYTPTILAWHKRLTFDLGPEYLKNEPWRSAIEERRRGSYQAVADMLRGRWDWMLDIKRGAAVYREMRVMGIGDQKAKYLAENGAPLSDSRFAGSENTPFDDLFDGNAVRVQFNRLRDQYGIEITKPT